jgi:hypothetical protein
MPTPKTPYRPPVLNSRGAWQVGQAAVVAVHQSTPDTRTSTPPCGKGPTSRDGMTESPSPHALSTDSPIAVKRLCALLLDGG